MKVLKLNTPFLIEAVVRDLPQSGDVLTFTAIEEFTQISTDYMIDWSINKGRLSFTLPVNSFDKAGVKFEISIINNGNIIYLGKMIVVNEDTDTQNFTPSKQTTQRFK